jgi:hypothetical protein
VVGVVAVGRENYVLFGFAALGEGIASAAVGLHFLRADDRLLGATALGTALLVLVLGVAIAVAARRPYG